MSIPGSASPLFIGAAAGAAAAYQIDRSVRLNSSDSSYFSRTPSSASNRRTWTWSAWIKKTGVGTQSFIWASLPANLDNYVQLYFSSDYLYFNSKVSGASATSTVTNALFRDPSAWFHVCLAIDTTATGNSGKDRLKLYINGRLLEDGDYQTDGRASIAHNSELRINNNVAHHIGKQGEYSGTYANIYLAECILVDGQQLAASDFGEYDDNNVWQPKAYSGSYGTNGFYLKFADNSSNAALGTDSSGNSNTWTVNNFLAAAGGSTTLSISGYNNNLGSYPLSNVYDGNTGTRVLGTAGSGGQVSFSPALSGVTLVRVYQQNYTHYLNGSVVTPSASTGSPGWQTLHSGSAITLSSVGNAFNTDNTASIDLYAIEINGVVVSSQSFTLGAASDVDSLLDTPTNYAADSGNNGGNYCTLNPLYGTLTLSNGNLDATAPGEWKGSAGTIGMSSGKFYWEIDNVTGNQLIVGIIKAGIPTITWNTTYGYNGENGYKYLATGGASYGASWTTGDVIGIAFDADNGSLTFYKNGTSQGVAATGLTDGPYLPSVVINGSSRSCSVNFGQRAFTYTNAGTNRPAATYLSLCTTNLSEPAIADGSTAFDVVTYTGNATTNTAITGLNYSPDLLWIKSRSSTQWHFLADTVRGATKNLASNDAYQEETRTNRLLSFDSNGFTIGNSGTVNQNNSNFVAWAWDAGTSTVSNTDGSITSNVRASQANGISIVSYTGSSSAVTVGHGLNAAPEMIIVKDRDSSVYNWQVAHISTGADISLILNTTAAAADYDAWSNTRPTNTVFSLGAGTLGVNTPGNDMIAYCFAPVNQFSSFGSYEGNGTNDGPFVFTGMRPRWIMIKNIDNYGSGYDWFVFDTERSQFNVTADILKANLSAGEYSFNSIDILSNGFKIRRNTNGINLNAHTHVWAAFAEHPFKTARAR